MLYAPADTMKAYAGVPRKEIVMITILLILVPLFALVIWAIVFDVRQRRRHAPFTGHDAGAAIRRARADAEGRGGSSESPGGGGSAGP